VFKEPKGKLSRAEHIENVVIILALAIEHDYSEVEAHFEEFILSTSLKQTLCSMAKTNNTNPYYPPLSEDFPFNIIRAVMDGTNKELFWDSSNRDQKVILNVDSISKLLHKEKILVQNMREFVTRSMESMDLTIDDITEMDKHEMEDIRKADAISFIDTNISFRDPRDNKTLTWEHHLDNFKIFFYALSHNNTVHSDIIEDSFTLNLINKNFKSGIDDLVYYDESGVFEDHYGYFGNFNKLLNSELASSPFYSRESGAAKLFDDGEISVAHLFKNAKINNDNLRAFSLGVLSDIDIEDLGLDNLDCDFFSIDKFFKFMMFDEDMEREGCETTLSR
jgi:hypothetical protein